MASAELGWACPEAGLALGVGWSLSLSYLRHHRMRECPPAEGLGVLSLSVTPCHMEPLGAVTGVLHLETEFTQFDDYKESEMVLNRGF